jgi:hypothetical protein
VVSFALLSLYPGERAPGTHWVGLRTGLDEVENRKFLPTPGLELRSLDLPTRSQALYQVY